MRAVVSPKPLLLSVQALSLICLVFLNSTATAAPLGARAGVFEQILIAVDDKGGVEGYYSDPAGHGGTETCAIAFKTNASASADMAIPVTLSDFSTIKDKGTMAFDVDSVTLTAKNYRKFAGCGMAGDSALVEGYEAALSRATSWTHLMRINSSKAFLHAAPNDGLSPHAYVIKDNVVGVLGSTNGWLHVEYVATADRTKSVTGWILASEAKPLVDQN